MNTNINGWRSIIGYVPQHIFLTDNTIVENIALGVEYEKIDLNRIKDVLMLSCLNKFIEELPLGLQTIVGEYGFQLSGGQRQRIGIARALYNNPKVLLFDEATSALDNDTEKEFMNLLYDLKGSKTIVIVAHRLSTLNKCDVIYKLDKGKLIRTK